MLSVVVNLNKELKINLKKTEIKELPICSIAKINRFFAFVTNILLLFPL